MVELHIIPYGESYFIRDNDNNIYHRKGSVPKSVMKAPLKYLTHYTIGKKATNARFPRAMQWIQANLNNLKIKERMKEVE